MFDSVAVRNDFEAIQVPSIRKQHKTPLFTVEVSGLLYITISGVGAVGVALKAASRCRNGKLRNLVNKKAVVHKCCSRACLF